MCCALLQVADLSTERKWQYAGSHLIIPRGAQFTNRFPTIVEPRNHSSPLRNAKGVSYPMEVVGDFTLEDKIFPGNPGDSLLFDSAKLARLQQKNYSIPMYLPLVSHTGHSPNVASGSMPSKNTFKSDTEALSQEVTPLVTPPTTLLTPEMARSPIATTLPRGKFFPRRKTMPSAKTLTRPLPRNHTVVEAGSTAQARTVSHLL